MFMMLFLSLSLSASASFSEIQIKVEEMNSEDGHILYILFDAEEGFPDDPSKSLRRGKILASEAKAGFDLKDLEDGEYAVSIIHDENDNDKLDTNFLGIPQEGVGFSNNPRLYFGAPSFKKCKFSLKGSKQLKIELKHFKQG
jgi:uncharacterized protein (DUF2141 family)